MTLFTLRHFEFGQLGMSGGALLVGGIGNLFGGLQCSNQLFALDSCAL